MVFHIKRKKYFQKFKIEDWVMPIAGKTETIPGWLW